MPCGGNRATSFDVQIQVLHAAVATGVIHAIVRLTVARIVCSRTAVIHSELKGDAVGHRVADVLALFQCPADLLAVGDVVVGDASW